MANKAEKKPILVIDDEESMRIALAEALSRSGHLVDCISNGYDALKKVQSSSCKLVITDVRMPKMNGLEVLQEIKKVLPQIPVIVITAYGTIHNAVEAMKKGATDYILKPFSFEELDAVVKRALMDGRGQGSSLRDEQKQREITTRDLQMLKLMDLAKGIAFSKSTVLIQGESGTGKELFARYIHQHSERREKKFIAVNCAAIPENLLESELFGYEKGAFTGAVSRRLGKFELADGSTLLLDEVSEMGLKLQAKLLRVLQEFEIDRVGGKEPVSIDVRTIATTNVELEQAIEEGKFREDLFYRLNVIQIRIPSLRERKMDIPLLAQHFLEKYSQESGKEIRQISSYALKVLLDYSFPGNVRELENIVERSVALETSNIILPDSLTLSRFKKEMSKNGVTDPDIPPEGINLEEEVGKLEKQLLLKALQRTNGEMKKAAELLNIPYRSIRYRLEKYGIKNGKDDVNHDS
ncbi:MAG: sigma-54-dependent Fis family transcriptional regulator [Deltaproteobacteria bacterium]|nr:sigma-54-dependent Fis family transcriptional regulator [Deltaproteobacteria bacterium]